MARSVLSEDRFQNEDAAFAFVEAALWPHGPICPHCGNVDAKRIKKMEGKTTRRGLYNCKECRKPFTVRMGTIFESLAPSLAPLAANHSLDVRQQEGRFDQSDPAHTQMQHENRLVPHSPYPRSYADGALAPMGGAGGIVEVDETYVGRRAGVEVKRGWAHHKNTVLTLVERGGAARSFHIENADKEAIAPIVRDNIARESHLMTDEARRYERLGQEFAKHDAVDHSREEYAYRDRVTGTMITTNTVEGFYSIFKRGMIGVYQHCGEQHLHRYLAEFDFRYSNRIAVGVDDTARAERALQGVKGKRLTYETTAQG